MKKKLLLLLGVMIIIALVVPFLVSKLNWNKSSDLEAKNNNIKVVTTFYPVYMIGLNLADQIDSIEIKSLTELNTGCLHDYQLTTEDMKIISNADVMVINGGGMESFLEDIKTNYPNLTIVDASEGITMLSNDLDGDQELYNPHVWLDPVLYINQIENVKKGLIEYINKSLNTSLNETLSEENKESNIGTNNVAVTIVNKLKQNADSYITAITEINNQLNNDATTLTEKLEEKYSSHKAVIFHDSFSYLANRIGIEVAFTVPLDSDTALSAGDIAEIIDKVKENNIEYLFTEEQYSDSIARQIEEETGAKVYIIDSVVTGDGAKDSYIKAMQKNIQVIKNAGTLE